MPLRALLIAVSLIASAVPALADELIGRYAAFIGQDDLYNSNGKRLDAPWQVLRQDRANFHKFGISQPGDEWDPFFGSVANRDAMEKMVRSGKIDRSAGAAVMRGGVMVEVRIWGRGGVGTQVDVTVIQ